MRSHATAAAIVVVGLFVPAMGQTRLWSVEFGSSEYDSPFDMLADGEGGVYVAGVTDGVMGGGEPRQDWLARLDGDGVQAWMVPIEREDPWAWLFFGSGYPALAPDGWGGVYVAMNGANETGTIARYAADGSRVWGRESPERPRGIVAIDGGSGGFYVVGNRQGSLGGDVGITRHDAEGQITWDKPLAYGGDQEAHGWAWALDGSDGLLLAGVTHAPIVAPLVGENDVFTTRVSPEASLHWLVQSPRPDVEFIVSLEAADGGYFACGFEQSETVGWVGRFSVAGAAIWRTNIDSPPDRESVIDVMALPDGGAVAVGWRSPGLPPVYSIDQVSLMFRVGADGNVLWTRVVEPGRRSAGLRLASDGAGGVFVASWIAGPLGASPGSDFQVGVFRYSLCLPDLSTSAVVWHPGYGVPDGVVSTDDFFYYLSQFAAGNVGLCDLTHGAVLGEPEYGTPDGALSNDDFFYYLDFYARGC